MTSTSIIARIRARGIVMRICAGESTARFFHAINTV
jgi:hypothetical protein